MKTAKQKKQDAAFIAKLKTIGITCSQPKAPCPCGMELVAAIPFIIRMERQPVKVDESESFAA